MKCKWYFSPSYFALKIEIINHFLKKNECILIEILNTRMCVYERLVLYLNCFLPKQDRKCGKLYQREMENDILLLLCSQKFLTCVMTSRTWPYQLVQFLTLEFRIISNMESLMLKMHTLAYQPPLIGFLEANPFGLIASLLPSHCIAFV